MDASTALTARETRTLQRCEQTISKGLATFRDVGQALLEIRDSRLYRDSHATFEAYCSERWEFSRQRAYQLIGAAQTVEAMSTVVDTPPTTERQIRPLLTVPEDQRADVWAEVVETAPVEDGKPVITTRHVEETVRQWREADEPYVEPEPVEEEPPMVEEGEPLEETPDWLRHVEAISMAAIETEGRPAVAERLQRLANEILMG